MKEGISESCRRDSLCFPKGPGSGREAIPCNSRPVFPHNGSAAAHLAIRRIPGCSFSSLRHGAPARRPPRAQLCAMLRSERDGQSPRQPHQLPVCGEALVGKRPYFRHVTCAGAVRAGGRESATCNNLAFPKVRLPGLHYGPPPGRWRQPGRPGPQESRSRDSARSYGGSVAKPGGSKTASPEPPSWSWKWNSVRPGKWNSVGPGLRLPDSGSSRPMPRQGMSRRRWRAAGGAAGLGIGCAVSSP